VSLFSSFEASAREFDLEAANWIRELSAAHDAAGEDEHWRTHAIIEAALRHSIFIGCSENDDGTGEFLFGPSASEWWDDDGCATEKHPANRSPRDWSERIKAAFPEATGAAASFTLIPIKPPPLPPAWEYPWTMPFCESVIDWRTGDLRRSK
jgi:hypothetical protein